MSLSWKILTEAPDAVWTRKWKDFLKTVSLPTHYTTPDFFPDPFVRGGEKFAALALDKNEIVAILTGIDDGKSIVSGLANRPQIIFGKNIDRSRAVQSLIGGLSEKNGKAQTAEIFSWEKIDEFEDIGFKSRKYEGEQGTVMLDLTIGTEEIFKNFSPTRRNEIRKALRRNQVQVGEIENETELAELHEIHKDWCRRKQIEPDTFAEMKQGFEQTEHRKIFIAKHEGKVVAGSFYRFCPGGLIEYAGNNSLFEYRKLHPNDLLGWHSIQWAFREGFERYSMGGAHLFLRHFGGEIVPTFRYKQDRSFLKIHDLKEAASDLTVSAYLKLPQPVKSKIKKILGRV